MMSSDSGTVEAAMMMFSDEAASCVELQSSWRRTQQSFQHQSVRLRRLLAEIPHSCFKRKDMEIIWITRTNSKGICKPFLQN